VLFSALSRGGSRVCLPGCTAAVCGWDMVWVLHTAASEQLFPRWHGGTSGRSRADGIHSLTQGRHSCAASAVQVPCFWRLTAFKKQCDSSAQCVRMPREQATGVPLLQRRGSGNHCVSHCAAPQVARFPFAVYVRRPLCQTAAVHPLHSHGFFLGSASGSSLATCSHDLQP
jgi:hypothetical protein